MRKVGLRTVDADTWVGPSQGDEKIALQRAKAAAPHRLTLQLPGRPPVNFTTGKIGSFQTFATAPGFEPIVIDESGHIVIGHLPDSNFFRPFRAGPAQ